MKNLLPGVPFIESPFFRQLFSSPTIDQETRRIALDLAIKGYAVLDFPDPDFDARSESIKTNLLQHYDLDEWRRSGHAQGTGLRVQDAWQFNEHVKSIASNQRILELLTVLYGRKAWPFQTLNFPVGTQQHAHTDSVHFSSSPERFMCGVWVAMEDVDDDNGALMYYPGSHRWPIYTNEQIGRCAALMEQTPHQTMYEEMWRALIEFQGAKSEHFYAKKGQALIWAANLMHGGSFQRDPMRTRWSQVTHYYFEDCSYYTPMTSDPFYGNIDFRKLVNITTGEEMPQRYAGHDIPAGFIEACKSDGEHVYEDFDGDLYLAANPDVAEGGWNPAEHYMRYGRKEKRRLRP